MPEAAPAITSSPLGHFRPTTLLFWAVHLLSVVGAFMMGLSWAALAWALGSYALRMFFITAGYHRYFSHRSYQTSRFFQFVLAFFAQTSAQKGVLWWAAHHRDHHKYADEEGDPHSPRLAGLYYAHVGWILDPRNDETGLDRVRDLAVYPELRWLNRFHLVPPVLYAVALTAIGGWEALFWGFFVSTVLTWHGTFTINSLTHVFGIQRFDSDDDSRNSWLLAILTFGEGWHNNHHHYQSATRQGMLWWEYDFSYYLLRLLAVFRIVWGFREPPERILAARRAGLVRAPIFGPWRWPTLVKRLL